MINKLREVDSILAHYEDWMHGYNGSQCTKARRLISEVIKSLESSSKKIEIPDWWKDYKLANPDDIDDYNPQKHCCKRFWKDFCDCVK